jgi:hypothetical protein
VDNEVLKESNLWARRQLIQHAIAHCTENDGEQKLEVRRDRGELQKGLVVEHAPVALLKENRGRCFTQLFGTSR